MNYMYHTTYEKIEKTMTHHMKAGYKVLVDFKNQLVITSQFDNVIEKLTMKKIGKLSQYKAYITMIARIAETSN